MSVPSGRDQVNVKYSLAAQKERRRKVLGESPKKLRRPTECFLLARRLTALLNEMSLTDACAVLGLNKDYARQLLPLAKLDPALLRYVDTPVSPTPSALIRAKCVGRRSSGRLTWGVGLLLARLPKEHQHALALTILSERLSEEKARRLVSVYREKHRIVLKRGNPSEGTLLRKLERTLSRIECLFSEHIKRVSAIVNEADGEPMERISALLHALRMIELHATTLHAALKAIQPPPNVQSPVAAT